jgi:hypothetical protein
VTETQELDFLQLNAWNFSQIYYVLICTHCQELKTSVRSHGSMSLFVMLVLVVQELTPLVTFIVILEIFSVILLQLD